MSYRLEGGVAFAQDIRRIAYEQIDEVLAHLKQPNQEQDEAIHEARKCFKKLRAVLRLIRDEIGETVFKRENRCFRDAGQRLALVRESAVMLQTLASLEQKHSQVLARDAFAPVREVLATTHEQLLADAFAPNQAVSQVIEMVEAARERLKDWPIDVKDFAAIAPSLQRVYRRGYKGRRDVAAEPTAENIHEWRKRVKYLWYQLGLLQPLWPELMKVWADEAHELADCLGDDHDLAVLESWMEKRPSLFDNTFDVLTGLIQQEHCTLQAQAMPLGQRIYAEKPQRFVERLEQYWHVWQSS